MKETIVEETGQSEAQTELEQTSYQELIPVATPTSDLIVTEQVSHLMIASPAPRSIHNRKFRE